MLGSTHFYYTNKWKIEKKNEGFPILEMVVVLLRTGIMGLTGRAKCNDTISTIQRGRERNEERDEIRRVASRRKEASACMHACGAATTAPLPPIRSSLLPKHKNH